MKADSYKPQRNDDAKKKSRDYFNTHKSSKLAHAGYWKHDYKYALVVIKRINPDNLIDIGCGSGAFLEEVHRNFADIKLSALDLSEEMIEVTRSRLSGLAELIVKDIKGYADRFSNTGDTISDASYKIYDLIQMVGKLIKPYADFMLQGIREKKIKNRLGVTKENAEEVAAFVLYGLWGLIYNDRFTQDKINATPGTMENMIKRLFY